MKKKLFIPVVILGVILLVLAGLFIYSRTSTSSTAVALKDFLPFGSGDSYSSSPRPRDDINPGDESYNNLGQDSEFLRAEASAGLFQLTTEPVAGFVSFTQNGSTTIRYTDRATGHIYDVDPSNKRITKITNTTLPKIYEAHFRADGAKVIYRTLKGETDLVENLSLTLSAPTATSTVSTSPSEDVFYTFTTTLLRGNIEDLVVGVGDSLYFVLKDAPSIVKSTFAGDNQTTLLSSAFTNWRLSPYGNNLLIWTKASANVSGYAYTLNTSNGFLEKIIGPLNGLTISSNEVGSKFLYSFNNNGLTELFVKSSNEATSYQLIPTTLSEKCAWKKNGVSIICGTPTSGIVRNEPDDWYRGITNYSDDIWLYNTDTTERFLTVEPKKVLNVDLDVYMPQISPLEDYFIFINRNDLSLWALNIEN
jgi:hypothetical protein